MPKLSTASKTPISSSNRKSVFLREWWLIEVERDSKLGIGGFVNRETLGSRGMRLLGSASVGKRYNLNAPENGIQVFASAAIAKRLDNNTLEAVDGITITISGCINRSRTLSYGFSAEYAAKSYRDKCANTTKRSLPMSFDDLPVTRVRDILLSTNGESESCAFTSIILRDILKQCSGHSLNQNGSSVDSVIETEFDHKQHDGLSLLNPTQKIIKDAHKIHKFPVDLHDRDMKSSKEIEDDYKQGNDGSISNANKISKESQANTHTQAAVYISSQPAANLAASSQKLTRTNSVSKTRTLPRLILVLVLSTLALFVSMISILQVIKVSDIVKIGCTHTRDTFRESSKGCLLSVLRRRGSGCCSVLLTGEKRAAKLLFGPAVWRG
ncbi:SANT associated [Cynara cardunculus var. scolymus]|uniref:SANT associated n=1 Tax=Cynara cardunculus var. scolymus TaxID=59895 RepID=A0A103XGI7_CYNCS|nr:SANT associated [Cynara cardunculus var. scolymus]